MIARVICARSQAQVREIVRDASRERWMPVEAVWRREGAMGVVHRVQVGVPTLQRLKILYRWRLWQRDWGRTHR